MTQHVVTRWYRPPELMLCPDGLYSFPVDMWSAGCIFAEVQSNRYRRSLPRRCMDDARNSPASLPLRPLSPRSQLLGRKPLFPGKNFVHQLSLIFDVIGAPRSGEVAHITNKQARKFLQGVQGKVKVPFERLYPSAPPLVIGLLESSLAFEPNDRLSAREALKHPYFAPFEPEKEVEPPIHPEFNFNFEHQQLPKAQLKGMILEEVSSFRREVRGEKRASSGVEANGTRADGHTARERSRERPASSSAAPRASSAPRAHSRAGGDRPDPYKAATEQRAQSRGRSGSSRPSSAAAVRDADTGSNGAQRSSSNSRGRSSSKPPVPRQGSSSSLGPGGRSSSAREAPIPMPAPVRRDEEKYEAANGRTAEGRASDVQDDLRKDMQRVLDRAAAAAASAVAKASGDQQSNGAQVSPIPASASCSVHTPISCFRCRFLALNTTTSTTASAGGSSQQLRQFRLRDHPFGETKLPRRPRTPPLHRRRGGAAVRTARL